MLQMHDYKCSRGTTIFATGMCVRVLTVEP